VSFIDQINKFNEYQLMGLRETIKGKLAMASASGID
jgi:hypothetical protein